MNDLISKFSHELRNVLTGVYSTVQLIESRHPEVSEFTYWPAITEDLIFMNDLITMFSNFAKVERIKLKPISSKSLLEQVSLSFAASIASSQVEYTSKLDPSLPIINGDDVTLKEVFRNLLKNAYDACLPDKTIYLEASYTDSEVIVQIKDTGCGIPEEYMPTLFDPFVTHKKDGTGLGLAICSQVIKMHGGKLEVQSTLGVGTVFTVSLPRGD